MDFYQGIFVANAVFLLIGFFLPLCLYRQTVIAKNIALASCILGCCCGLIGSVSMLINSNSLVYTGWKVINIFSVQLKVDSLSAYFLCLVNLLSIITAIFSKGYLSENSKKETGILALMNLFSLSLSGVIVADNSVIFLIFWEMMALISFALLMFEHEQSQAKLNSYIYLVITHLGTAFITVAFLILYFTTGSTDFAEYMNIGKKLDGITLNILFICALIGFGAKLGVFPLHVWLPRAYSLGPINVITLMSSAMIKTAVYALCRFYFAFLNCNFLWWGIFLLLIGIVSALYGIGLAVMQNNIKKFLAYSSSENMGIILISMGATLIFSYFEQNMLAGLAFLTLLFHAANHTFFKGLLFMGCGAVFKSAKSFDLSFLGGLNKKMPYTGACFLIGLMSLASLPPFAGFISEWLLLQTLFQLLFFLNNPFLKFLIIMIMVLVILVGGLALMGAVKQFGIAFLGKARSIEAQEAIESGVSIVFSQVVLACLLLALGILPQLFIKGVNNLIAKYFAVLPNDLLLLVIPQNFAGIKNLNILFLAIIFISIMVTVYGVMILIFHKSRYVFAETWNCGTKHQAVMEYSATSFSHPFMMIFKKIIGFERKTVINCEYEYYPKSIEHSFSLKAKILKLVYIPLVDFVLKIFRSVKIIQNGKLRDYLSYMVIALIVSLLLVW